MRILAPYSKQGQPVDDNRQVIQLVVLVAPNCTSLYATHTVTERHSGTPQQETCWGLVSNHFKRSSEETGYELEIPSLWPQQESTDTVIEVLNTPSTTASI